MKAAIRRLDSKDDFTNCVQLQSLAWGLSIEDTVSEATLKAAIRHGALLLGTYQGKNLAGFCFSLPSLWQGRPAHHSHMLAVRPNLRDRGLGFLLKKAQFEHLRSRVDWITWTFDPLESRNARLNLKLGVTIRTYLRDLYGDGSECRLHQGLGTDRFIAEWNLRKGWRTQNESCPVPPAIDPAQKALESQWDNKGFYGSPKPDLTLSDPLLYLEIPSDIQKIKAVDDTAAREWRAATRISLEHYFSRGYSISKFLTWTDAESPTRRSFYLLENQPDS